MAVPVVRRRQNSTTAVERLLKKDPNRPALVRLPSQGRLTKLQQRRHTFESHLTDGVRALPPEPPAAPDTLRKAFLISPNASREPSADIMACQLALRYKLTRSEVQRIIKEVGSAKLNEHGGMDRQEFDKVMCRICDLEQVDDQMANSAYLSIGAQRAVNVEEFLVWYRQNMFNLFNALNAAPAASNSAKLVYELAKKHEVSVGVIDKAKSRFDYYDLDKSGSIEYNEFENMFCSILKTKDAAELNPERLKRFWQEIDHNADGKVDFPEFTRWYLKYFNPDSDSPEDFDMTGPLRAFYESYDPTVQRRISLRGLGKLPSC